MSLLTTKCNKNQFFDIFYHIKSLKYVDRPDYDFIRNKLKELLNVELMILSIGDNSFINYLTNSLFPQDYMFNHPLFKQKDTTKHSSESPNNNFILENQTSIKQYYNLNENNKVGVKNNNENDDLLRKKRIRNHEGSLIDKAPNEEKRKIVETGLCKEEV